MTVNEFKELYNRINEHYPHLAKFPGVKGWVNNLALLPAAPTITAMQYWQIAQFCDENKRRTFDELFAPRTPIGAKVAASRERRGWSQTDLADKLGTSQKQVSRWECGRTPNVTTLKKIADVLGVSVDDLI